MSHRGQPHPNETNEGDWAGQRSLPAGGSRAGALRAGTVTVTSGVRGPSVDSRDDQPAW
ncbi:hypothetical protein BaRGS_00040581, partial [Batillaria attramentaria]